MTWSFVYSGSGSRDDPGIRAPPAYATSTAAANPQAASAFLRLDNGTPLKIRELESYIALVVGPWTGGGGSYTRMNKNRPPGRRRGTHPAGTAQTRGPGGKVQVSPDPLRAGRAGRSAEDRLLCKQEALGSNPSRSIASRPPRRL